MARTLPWTIDHAPPPKKPRVTPAPRAQQGQLVLHADGDKTDGETTTNDRGRASRANVTAIPSRRTPSSSPVRGPPPAELMREGYDGDDIYVMVEDEFQTVAQSYTGHLHHAEYKRLVRQAREAAPKALPEPISPMSEETMNRLRAAALAKKQKDTLQRITGPALNGEEEEDQVPDLWSGTSLAPLMASSSQQKRSLVGLGGISSSTKAGLGFARSQNSREEIREEGEKDLDLDTARPNAALRQKGAANSSTSRAIENKFVPQQNLANPNSASRMAEKTVPECRSFPAHTRPTERPATKHRFILDLDDGFDPPTNSGDDARKSRPAPLSNGNTSLKRKADSLKEQKKKSRLDEVPMFII